MSRTRGEFSVSVEPMACRSWAPVCDLVDRAFQSCKPRSVTKKYLRHLNAGALDEAQRDLIELRQLVLLARLRADPREGTYDVQAVMRLVSRNVFLVGLPVPSRLVLVELHKSIGEILEGTAFGVGWPARPDGWGSVEPPKATAEIYRRIRREADGEAKE